MSIKFVSGVPGSGKSYYVMREVLLKHFEYDNDFHEWKQKSKDPLNIITNIDGLRLPHIKFDSHLKENGIHYTQFFTRQYFKELTGKIGPCIIILDEAQKFFPKSFKENKDIVQSNDFEKSVFYFFEYHRHLDVDVYLMAQLWTRMHPDIVGLCEYQVKAVPRTLSLVGEFRYHLCLGSDVLSRVTVKSDKKIFALYQSTESGKEVKTNQIRPLRKYVVIILCLVCIGIFSARKTFSMLRGDHSSTKIAAASPPIDTPKVKPAIVPAGKSPPAQAGRELLAQPEQKKPVKSPDRDYDIFRFTPPDLVRLKCGSVWDGSNLFAIEFFGKLIEPADFPHPFQVDSTAKIVTVLLPRSVFLAAERVQVSERFALAQLESGKKTSNFDSSGGNVGAGSTVE